MGFGADGADANCRKSTTLSESKSGTRLCYCSGCHALHSATLIGEVRRASILNRMTPSDVEQKLRPPVLVATGVATTTYSLHTCCRQTPVALKRNPDFVHHAPAVQLAPASEASIMPAWSADGMVGLCASGPSVARSGAKPLRG